MSDSVEPQYSVDAILAAKVTTKRKGKVYWKYLVRWTGYDSDADSWEPPEAFNTNDLINKFWDLVGNKDINDPEQFSINERFDVPRVGPPKLHKRKSLLKQSQESKSPSRSAANVNNRPASPLHGRKLKASTSPDPDYASEVSTEPEVAQSRALSTTRDRDVIKDSPSSRTRSRRASGKRRMSPQEHDDEEVTDDELAQREQAEHDESDSSQLESTRALHRLSHAHQSSPPISQTGSLTRLPVRSGQRSSFESADAPPPSPIAKPKKRKRLSTYVSSNRKKRVKTNSLGAGTDEVTERRQTEVWRDSIEDFPTVVALDIDGSTSQKAAIAVKSNSRNGRPKPKTAEASQDRATKMYASTAIQTIGCTCDHCLESGRIPASFEMDFEANGLLSDISADVVPETQDTAAILSKGTLLDAQEHRSSVLEHPVATPNRRLSTGPPTTSQTHRTRIESTAQRIGELDWTQLRIDFNIPQSWNTEDAVFEEIKRRNFKLHAPTAAEEQAIRDLINGYRLLKAVDSQDEIEEAIPSEGTEGNTSPSPKPATPTAESGLFSSPAERALAVQDLPTRGQRPSSPDDVLPLSATTQNVMPAHHLRTTDSQIKRTEDPKIISGHITGITTKAQLAHSVVRPSGSSQPMFPTGPSSATPVRPPAAGVAVATSPNGTPHRQFLTAKRAGPGRDSIGLTPAARLQARSSILTFDKGGAKTLKGSYPTPSGTTQRETVNTSEHMEDKNKPLFQNDEDDVMEVDGEDTSFGMPTRPVPKDVPMTAEEMLARAGLNRKEAETLPDFEDDDAGQASAVETSNLTANKSARDPRPRPTVLGLTTATAAVTPIEQQHSNMQSIRSSVSSMFGALGVGSLRTPPPNSDARRSSLAETTLTIKLSEAARIPVKLQNLYPNTASHGFVQVAASARTGGPSGKYYSGSFVGEIMNTVRTAGTHASAVYDEANEIHNSREHWDRMVRRLGSGDIFLAMVGAHLIIFCASENVTVGRKMNVREALLGISHGIVASQAIIIDEQKYANIAIRAG